MVHRLQKQIPYEKGRNTIGWHLDNIVHSTEWWKGNCVCVCLNIKKIELTHFLKHRTQYYSHYPSGSFSFC